MLVNAVGLGLGLGLRLGLGLGRGLARGLGSHRAPERGCDGETLPLLVRVRVRVRGYL